MSLVNNSLQNLEARRGEEPLSNYAAASVRLGHKEKNLGARKSLFIGCLLIGLAIAVYLFQSEPNQSQKQASTSIISAGAMSATALPSPYSENQQTHIKQPQPIADKQIVTSDLISTTIALLMQSGASALKADRLVLPANTSAQSYYQQILLLDPNNEMAQLGLKNIAERYSELAQTLFRKSQRQSALELITLGLTVVPDNAKLLILRTEIESSPRQEQTTLAATAPTEISPPPQQSPPQTSSLSVQPSSAGAENHQYRLTKEKIAKGAIDEAINDLEKLAATGSIGKKSTRLLANLYLQQQRPQDAEELIKQQAILSKAEAAYIIARAQVQTHNLAGALATLEAQSPSISNYPDYYSLLAGVYQQGQQYRQAIAIYKKLSQLQPNTYTHWLGLAAALDSLRKPTALAAFGKVLPMIPEQQHELKQYVQQRLQQLSTQ